MNTRKSAIVWTVLAVVVTLVILGVLVSALPQSTVGAETVHVARPHSADYTDYQPAPAGLLPTFNTGECGYYKEQGMIHRNEFITPSWCFHDNGDETIPQARPMANKHTVEPTVTIDN